MAAEGRVGDGTVGRVTLRVASARHLHYVTDELFKPVARLSVRPWAGTKEKSCYLISLAIIMYCARHDKTSPPL